MWEKDLFALTQKILSDKGGGDKYKMYFVFLFLENI